MKKQHQKPLQKQGKSSTKELFFLARYWRFLALIVLCFILYAQTFSFSYALDDRIFITEHKAVQQGLAGLPELWTKHSMYSSSLNINQGRYRPLTFTTFALEQAIAPGNPRLGHIVQVLLYCLVVILVYAVTARLFPKKPPLFAWAVAAIFAAHPIHAEVVANIKSRDIVLACIWSFLAIWYYIGINEHLSVTGKIVWKHIGYCTLLMILALLSQEGAIIFALILPLVGWFVTPGISPRRQLVLMLPILCGIILVLVWRSYIVGTTDNSWMNIASNNLYVLATGSEAIATKISVLGRYLGKVVFPVTMSCDYGYKEIEVIGWSHWLVWGSALAYLLLFVLAARKFRERHILTFCILFYCFAMIVASNFFLYYGMVMSDRMLFVSSFAFVLFVVWGLTTALEKRSPQLLYGLIGLCIVVYSMRTVARNPAWANDYTLNKTDALESAPRCIALKTEYGRLCIEEAVASQDNVTRKMLAQTGYQQIHEVLALDTTTYSTPFAVLGQYFAGYEKRLDSAAYYYRRAIRLDTAYMPFRFNLLSVMADSTMLAKNYSNAEALYRQMLSYNLNQDFIYVRLAQVYGQQQRWQDAHLYAREALKYNANSALAQQIVSYSASQIQQQKP